MENKLLAAYSVTALAIAIALQSIFDLYGKFFSGAFSLYEVPFDNVFYFFKYILIIIFAFAVYQFSKDILDSKNGIVKITSRTIRPLTLTLISTLAYVILDFVRYLLFAFKVLSYSVMSSFMDGTSYQYVPEFNLFYVLVTGIVVAVLVYFTSILFKVQNGAAITISNKSQKRPATMFSKIIGVVMALIGLGVFLTLIVAMFTFLTYDVSQGDYTLFKFLRSAISSGLYFGFAILGMAVLMTSANSILTGEIKVSKMNAWVYFAGSLIFGLATLLYSVFAGLPFILELDDYFYASYSGLLVALATAIGALALAALMWRSKTEDKYLQIK